VPVEEYTAARICPLPVFFPFAVILPKVPICTSLEAHLFGPNPRSAVVALPAEPQIIAFTSKLALFLLWYDAPKVSSSLGLIILRFWTAISLH
jgi:hypothetical protein